MFDQAKSLGDRLFEEPAGIPPEQPNPCILPSPREAPAPAPDRAQDSCPPECPPSETK